MNEMECTICYNEIEEGAGHNKWTCSHSFHETCILYWDKSCPVCRCDDRKDIKLYKYTNIYFDIEYFLSWAKRITYDVSNYKCRWISYTCIQENHNIIYYNDYKPMGVCHNCSIVQTFAYEP